MISISSSVGDGNADGCCGLDAPHIEHNDSVVFMNVHDEHDHWNSFEGAGA